MPEYRRSWIAGGTYFFTVVTHERRPILTAPDGLRSLRSAWSAVRQRFPFRTRAVCVLPDHLHCIWELPRDDEDYAIRWRGLKGSFSRQYLDRGGRQGRRSRSRRSRNEVAVWQRRFWEHTIRDEDDLRRHIDYIHYNPVKHGYVARVADWRWSSFHRYVRGGWYDPRWGEGEPSDLATARTTGE